jgi:hypothetical protein
MEMMLLRLLLPLLILYNASADVVTVFRRVTSFVIAA